MNALTVTTAIAVLLQLLDVHSTLAFMRTGRGEANPFIRWAMDRLGRGWIVVKLAVGLGGVAAVWWAGSTWAMAAICAVYAVVVWRNYRIAEGKA